MDSTNEDRPATSRSRGRPVFLGVGALVLGIAAVRALRGAWVLPTTIDVAAAEAPCTVLHYPVPTGQDPAAAMTALRLHGYSVRPHTGGTSYEVEIRAETAGPSTESRSVRSCGHPASTWKATARSAFRSASPTSSGQARVAHPAYP